MTSGGGTDAPVRVLLVEDDAAHQELVRRAFEGAGGGFRLSTAGTLAEARALIAREAQDLVIADWRLPDGNGLELVPPRGGAAAPVVLMTSHGSERLAVEALQAGALDYVVKSPEALADMPHLARRAMRQWHERAEGERMAAALRESEERYREVVESANSVILRWDTEGRITFINPFGLELFGFAEEELVGRSALGTIVPDVGTDGRDLRAMIREIEAEPARFERNENENMCKDGRRVWIDWTNRPVRDTGGRLVGILSVGNDVTARRAAEEERRRLEEQLRQSQKIESVGRLAGGVAHDFNNMLSPILGYGEMLRDQLGREDPRRNRVELILQAAARCRDLVRQLLAFARRQTLEMRPLDLNAVVSGFVPMLRRTLREDVAVETRLAPAPGTVTADARQIEQVILNLAINAQDAMPDGGRLLIETADVVLDEEYARTHEWVTPGPHVLLAVSDTGSGMAPETLARIFEPFFTTKEYGKGTGLGLAMVYGIVKQHDGSITAYSEPGIGTTFRIYLPRSTGAAAIPAAPAQGIPPGGGETVLVVEDEEQVRSLAVEVLDTLGYTVLQAENAAAALAVAAAHAGRIDLLLSDVILPDMNGRVLHERLAAGGQLPALYMSGYPADVISHHGVLDEGVDLLRKPFTVRELAARVRARLDR